MIIQFQLVKRIFTEFTPIIRLEILHHTPMNFRFQFQFQYTSDCYNFNSNINYSSTTANSGGNITDGGASVTARGVVWNTSQNPTIALSTKTIDGTGTGNFSSAISGLTPNTTYYLRAYATNSAGTAYGNEITFTTMPTIGQTYQGESLLTFYNLATLVILQENFMV